MSTTASVRKAAAQPRLAGDTSNPMTPSAGGVMKTDNSVSGRWSKRSSHTAASVNATQLMAIASPRTRGVEEGEATQDGCSVERAREGDEHDAEGRQDSDGPAIRREANNAEEHDTHRQRERRAEHRVPFCSSPCI